MSEGEVSLRPMGLRPGGGTGGNPFSMFGKGAGVGLVRKTVESSQFREERKKKPPGEIITYTREFLMKYSEHCNAMPPELANQPEIILDKNNVEEVGEQRQILQRVAAELPDDRDWRARTTLPPAPASNGSNFYSNQASQRPQQEQSGAQNGSWTSGAASSTQGSSARKDAPPRVPSSSQISQAAANGPGPKIQKAEEVGRKAWVPGSNVQGNDKALKAIKGILNKLTPEKFERLLGQLVDYVGNAEILHGTITLVFENAVAQPTFVAMYSELCDNLSKVLPDFAPAEGETKPMTFRRILLNTCQEEFEGTADARAGLKDLPPDERENAERKVKLRTLGNIRLISELYKRDVVPEKILHYCIQNMLGDGKTEPFEENVEAMCEMLTVAGKKMDLQGGKSKPKMDGYFVILEKWSKSKNMASRIRFMLRDVLDLRKSKWIPRRETVQAKKLTEIRSEAMKDLGMMPATLVPAMQNLPPLPRGTLAAAQEEVDLFPAFKGSDDGWETAGKKKKKDGSVGGSALIGPPQPVVPASAPPAAPAASRPAEAAAAASPEPSPAAPAPLRSRKDMTEEDQLSLAKSLFSDFLTTGDLAEGLASAREIAAPGFSAKMVEEGINKLFDCTKDREHDLLIQLLTALLRRNVYSKEEFLTGLRVSTDRLSDLMLDVPKAPKLLGSLLGHCLLEGALSADVLPDLCKPIEEGEPRRALIGVALKYVKGKAGEGKLAALAKEADIHASAFLEADPEIDPPDLPSVEDWLKEEGLQAVPV
eukprot:jgi/Botrbrau1/16501/Bobra.0142s0095.1